MNQKKDETKDMEDNSKGGFPCWNLIPDFLDQVESQMDSNAIYYFKSQTWNLVLQTAKNRSKLKIQFIRCSNTSP